MGQKITQIAVNTLPFWSRFIVGIDLRYDGVNCFRTVIQRGQRFRVFDYRQGENQAQALGGAEATERDTILTTAGKTRGGARYVIQGMSITKDGYPYTEGADSNGLEHELFPGFSEQPCNQENGPVVPSVEDMRSLNALMLQAFLMSTYTLINVDGVKRTLEMGPSPLYPGQGGAKDGIDSTNGDVFVSNFMPIPEAIVWNPSGAADSNFVVNLQAAYDIVVPTWTTPTGTANGLPVSVENPEITDAIRTALGRNWKQAFILNFHGQEQSPVSNVS